MSIYYLNTIVAFLLGQFLTTAIVVYLFQKEKSIDYFSAMQTYIKAEIGYFIIGLFGIIAVCFVLSDYIDLKITKADLLVIKERTFKENMQLYFKTYALIVGSFIQLIAFKFRDKGKQAIVNVSDKI